MATKFFMNGGVDSKWSTDGNWSTTASSGPANTTKAVNGDAAVLDSGSPNCTIDVASACTSIVCTGYTHTLTFTGTLTTSGTVTLASGMTIAGTADLICLATATLTSGGITLTGGLQLGGTSQTYTLSGAWIVTGTLTSNGTTQVTLNGSTLSCGGIVSTTAITAGTTTVTMTSGTWSGSGVFRPSLTLASGVTVSGSVAYSNGTLTATAGAITTTGSSLSISQATTFNTSAATWNNVTFTAAATYTLNSLLNVSGALTCSAAAVFSGTAGWTANTFAVSISASRTITLKSGLTYTITSSAVANTTATATLALVASTPGTKAILTANTGVDMSLPYVSPTDIDSSGGSLFYTYKGTITTSSNWYTGTLPGTTVTLGAGALSTTAANTNLGAIFQSGGVGATFYLGLSTTTPTVAGANITEPSGSNYSRVAFNPGSTNWSAAAAGEAKNKLLITFPTASGSWGTPTYLVIFDASSAGNMIAFAAIDTPTAIGNSDSATFPVGNLVFA